MYIWARYAELSVTPCLKNVAELCLLFWALFAAGFLKCTCFGGQCRVLVGLERKCLQALLAAGEPARASLCLKVLLESSLEQHKADTLVLLFLVKSGFKTGTTASLKGALGYARSAQWLS